jgi:ubiquinone/menaquinone biosynthesis C-methylase UbiE
MPLRRKHGVRFKASELEIGRTYMWRREFLPALYKYLELHKGQTIVDVGCGTGAFSRLLLNGIKYEGKVLGIDRNRRLLLSAKRIAKETDLPANRISFKFGSAGSLPLENNFADRVICQMVLWMMTQRTRRRTINEMIRVCKLGGLVGAIDCAVEKVAYFYPNNQRLTFLANKYQSAMVLGMKKRYGYDKNIGYKVPSLFKEAGLKRIRFDGYAYVWLECDDRVPFDFRLKDHKSRVDQAQKFAGGKMSVARIEDERIALEGGMIRKEIEEMRELYLKQSKAIVDDPKLLNDDTSMNSGIFYITTGIK